MAKRRPQKSPRTQSFQARVMQAELWATGAKEGAWQLVEHEIKHNLLAAHPELKQHFAVLRPITREFGLEWLRHYEPLVSGWLRMVQAADQADRRLPDELIALQDVPPPVLLAAWARWLGVRHQQFARRFPQHLLRRMARLVRESAKLPIPGEWKPTDWIRRVQTLEQTAAAFHACLKAKALRHFLPQKSRNEALTVAAGQLVRTMKILGSSEYRAVKFISAQFPGESYESIKGRVRRARLNRLRVGS